MPYPEKKLTTAEKLGIFLGFSIVVAFVILVLMLLVAGLLTAYRFIF